MLVTARAEYACLAMLELSARFSDPKPVRLTEVTDKHDIPQRFLVQILLQMKAAGLVITTRGAAGGYQLARSPDTITLADILSVLDRMDDRDDLPTAGTVMARRLQKVWRDLADERMNFLRRITLHDLLPEANDAEYMI